MEEYITKRTKICRACPICDQENEVCNAHLYLNPENNDVSTTEIFEQIYKMSGASFLDIVVSFTAICSKYLTALNEV